MGELVSGNLVVVETKANTSAYPFSLSMDMS